MIRTFAARFAPAFLLILIALIGVPASAQDGGRVLESREFKSQILGRTVRYSVYLPAGYESNTTRHYPTVYLLHGMPFEPVNSETDWVQQGSADRLVGDAIGRFRKRDGPLVYAERRHDARHVDERTQAGQTQRIVEVQHAGQRLIPGWQRRDPAHE